MPSGRIAASDPGAAGKAAGADEEWPTVRQICRVTRWRQRKDKEIWQEPKAEVVYLKARLSAEDASP